MPRYVAPRLGLTLDADADTHVLQDLVARTARHLGLDPDAAPSAPPATTLTLSCRTTPRLPALPSHADETTVEFGLRVVRTPDACWLAHDAVRVMLDGERTIRCWVAAGADAERSAFLCLLLALTLQLRHAGWFHLHAAALAWQDQGVLLVGTSDRGKSTLSYSLARSGWTFVTDDSLLFRPQDAGARVAAFRRYFGLDAEAVDYFPELAAVWRDAPAEKGAVPVRDLYPERARWTCRPTCIVLPRIADADASTVEPASTMEAYDALIQQSALVTLRDGRSQAHLDAIGRLVRQTRHYRLHAGRDVIERPERVSALLREVVEADVPVPEV